MSLNTSYSALNIFDEIAFVAGSTYTLRFTVVNQSGTGVDLSSATIRWKLAPYGSDYAVVEKTGVVTATSVFEVNLSASDTDGLGGKYSYQPIITFANGAVIIPGQGILTLIKGL